MASIGSSVIPQMLSASITDSNTVVTIFNVTATLAATEYSQALPANCKGFVLKPRTNSEIQLAYTSGDTGTLFITIPKGTSYEDLHFYSGQTIYFRSSIASTIIEIIAYSKV